MTAHPRLDGPVPFARPDITETEIQAMADAVRSGWLTTGPNAASLENEFKRFLGNPNLEAVALNSATAGLHLALEGLGIGPGDEVIVPTWTFTATAEVVEYVGATPVFVDSDPETLNLDLEAANRAVTRRTRAIIPVHFAGMPISRSALSDFACVHGLVVVEDAAHAFPVMNEGRYVGDGLSEAVVFSFYATKTMTTGEGGMLVTPDVELARRARMMRLHGINRDAFARAVSHEPAWHYNVEAAGYKYNLPDPLAALGRVQLSRAIEMRAARERIAATYSELLAGLPLILPTAAREDNGHSWHLYVVRLSELADISRDEFIEQLTDCGISTSVHFIPLHLQPYWRSAYQLRSEDFPVASAAYPTVVSLPIFSAMSRDQVDRVARTIHSVLTPPVTSLRRST
ncbi:MAG TPA: DegT/DnrJ/EryC1/StrS family aminotransferase [Actinomycetaceae bacterium]|nr:DegT/DnrJ/EryC1/StrS family aminotransferase [Actinomycetaceae bacterium]